MTDVSEIMREFDAILAYAVHIKSLRHDLRSFFKNDFTNILSPAFKVIPNDHPEKDDSNYFYVFKSNSDMNKGSLDTVTGLVNKLLIDHPNDNYKFTIDMERLKALASNTREVYRKGKKVTIPQKKMVDLTFDAKGNVTRIHLLDCVLLIRLSNHNVGEYSSEKARRNYEIRKSVVDNILYYNVEDDFNVYNPKEKLGEKHRIFIETEFREKLVIAGIQESLINKIIEIL